MRISFMLIKKSVVKFIFKFVLGCLFLNYGYLLLLQMENKTKRSRREERKKNKKNHKSYSIAKKIVVSYLPKGICFSRPLAPQFLSLHKIFYISLYRHYVFVVVFIRQSSNVMMKLVNGSFE